MVRARALAKVVKAKVKEKVKANLAERAENAQLVMAQVWDQAPAQTKEAKAMALALENPKAEKAQKVEEMVLEKVMLVRRVAKDRLALKVKSAEIAMAQAVKLLSMTLLTILANKECRKLKRRLLSKPLKISQNNKNNAANNAKNVLTKPKNPEMTEMLKAQ